MLEAILYRHYDCILDAYIEAHPSQPPLSSIESLDSLENIGQEKSMLRQRPQDRFLNRLKRRGLALLDMGARIR